jgi:hypothetical protein
MDAYTARLSGKPSRQIRRQLRVERCVDELPRGYAVEPNEVGTLTVRIADPSEADALPVLCTGGKRELLQRIL